MKRHHWIPGVVLFRVGDVVDAESVNTFNG
jgi:hypothetical protein